MEEGEGADEGISVDEAHFAVLVLIQGARCKAGDGGRSQWCRLRAHGLEERTSRPGHGSQRAQEHIA